jgi:signal transduction histidine kinase
MRPEADGVEVRLADFIITNIQTILTEWDAYAWSIWPRSEADQKTVRDDAEEMLHSLASDMKSAQTTQQQADKSKGRRDADRFGALKESASALHAKNRTESGFDVYMMMAEYRALRAYVLRLWFESSPPLGSDQVGDIVRFNEGIDRLVANSTRWFNDHLEQSRRMFLGMLGHDLRNPLYAVSMISSMLTESKNIHPEDRDLANRICTSVGAMKAMISDLLDFSSSRLGTRMVIKPVPMDFCELCEEVIQEIRAVHPAREFEFIRSGDLEGEWDRGRIRQLLSNLIGNAVQHGARATPITISAAGFPEQIEISVHNHGAPIPKDSIGGIFDPLAQVSKVARPEGSIGLGLFIAQQVVNRHGGTISVLSSEKIGTTFEVAIPRYSKNVHLTT